MAARTKALKNNNQTKTDGENKETIHEVGLTDRNHVRVYYMEIDKNAFATGSKVRCW